MSYRVLDAHGRYAAWADIEPDPEVRETVLEWLFKLGEDPFTTGGPAEVIDEGVFKGRAVVPGTRVTVTWALFMSPPWHRHQECITILGVR